MHYQAHTCIACYYSLSAISYNWMKSLPLSLSALVTEMGLCVCVCSQVLRGPRYPSWWFQRGTKFHLPIRSVLHLCPTSHTGRHSDQTL